MFEIGPATRRFVPSATRARLVSMTIESFARTRMSRTTPLGRGGCCRRRGAREAMSCCWPKQRGKAAGQQRLAIGGVGDRRRAADAVAAVGTSGESQVGIGRAAEPVRNVEQRAAHRDRQRP